MIKLLTLLILFSLVAHAGDKNVYEIKNGSPELKLNDDGASTKPNSRWHLALVRSNLIYKLETLSHTTPEFNQWAVGIMAGKSYLSYEANILWQQFQRSTTSSSQKQKINLLQLNLLKNFEVTTIQQKYPLKMGLGVAPLYLTSEKSPANNTLSKTGLMGLLNSSLSYPQKYEGELGLLFGVGKIDSQNITLVVASLGVRFE